MRSRKDTGEEKMSGEALVTQFVVRMKEVGEALHEAGTIFGYSPDSIFAGAVCRMAEAYVEAVAHAVNDRDGWIEWFWLENGLGKKQMEAKGAGEKKARPIKTAKDLWRLIQDSAKENTR
jgi:hypothetical protein